MERKIESNPEERRNPEGKRCYVLVYHDYFVARVASEVVKIIDALAQALV